LDPVDVIDSLVERSRGNAKEREGLVDMVELCGVPRIVRSGFSNYSSDFSDKSEKEKKEGSPGAAPELLAPQPPG
jgi:hypothetical protein